MKKYLFSVFVALLLGFFMAKTFLEQYDSYQGIKMASNTGEMLYFVKLDSFSSLEEMEKATISLVNYIYKENQGIYDVYVGITKNSQNLIKISNYYSSLGYKTYTEEFLVTNQEFLNALENYDSILENTDDSVVVSSINSQVLEKYEDIVHGSQD